MKRNSFKNHWSSTDSLQIKKLIFVKRLEEKEMFTGFSLVPSRTHLSSNSSTVQVCIPQVMPVFNNNAFQIILDLQAKKQHF